MKVDSCVRRNSEIVELAEFVEDGLESAEVCAEYLGKLTNLLADKGLITFHELQTILPNGIYISEVH